MTTAGQSRIPARATYPPGGHPKNYDFDWRRGRVLADHQVVYISSGRGWFESRGVGRRRIESGDAFLLFPGVWHRYAPDRRTGWDEHWVGFDGEMARRLVRNRFFSPRAPVVRVAREDAALGVFNSIMDAIKTHQPALQQVLAGLTAHLLSLLYSTAQASLTEDTHEAAAIREAVRLMHADPQAKFALPDLARQLHVSYTWFRRAFAQHTGLSPHQYLLQLRIARARSLLAESNWAVKEIAAQAGFESEYYFCRVFKKKTGLTPGEWRGHSRRKA
ncbi:MAG: AraC family transcriptional regulator [Verrucomicrobia bacterium]|nr:AraC family transcriptional regulator [Verrucomicrobiota bacterium]